jgi:hypothetical protein
MPLLRRTHEVSASVSSHPVPPEMLAAREALVHVEQRMVRARTSEVVDIVNRVRDLYLGGPVDTCRDALRGEFASVGVEATTAELDAIAHVISTSELEQPILSTSVDAALSPSERAAISMKTAEIAEIMNHALARTRRSSPNEQR